MLTKIIGPQNKYTKTNYFMTSTAGPSLLTSIVEPSLLTRRTVGLSHLKIISAPQNQPFKIVM